MNDKRLQGRVALVTGAAHGFGKAIARRLAEEGATVLMADIDRDAAETAAAEIGCDAAALTVDIASDHSVEALAAVVGELYGRCEILVNNAAILDMTGISSMTMERYRAVLDVNQDGAVRVTLAMLALVRAAREPR